MAAVVVVAGMAAFREPDVRDGFLAWAGTSFGALYLSLLAFAAGILAIAPGDPRRRRRCTDVLSAGQVWLLVLLVTVWCFDSFAYLAGRTFKRGHFLNHISPNKTWSGVIGGTVAAIIVGRPAGLGSRRRTGRWAGARASSSRSPRSRGMWRSRCSSGRRAPRTPGTLIPGHGGVLDRIDSFLFAAPAVFGYLVIVGQIGTTI